MAPHGLRAKWKVLAAHRGPQFPQRPTLFPNHRLSMLMNFGGGHDTTGQDWDVVTLEQCLPGFMQGWWRLGQGPGGCASYGLLGAPDGDGARWPKPRMTPGATGPRQRREGPSEGPGGAQPRGPQNCEGDVS
jgi:hypothetical protein